MTLKDRPDLRTPDHDLAQTNSALLPTVYQTNGIDNGSIGNPRAHNGLLHSSGVFLRYFDFAGVRNVDWLSPQAMRLTSGATGQLAYPLASGLAGLSPVPTAAPPTYMFEGTRLAFDLTLTKPDPSVIPASVNLDPITFAASRVTWIYITAAGVVSLDVQAPATPAAPPAGSFAVVGVTTDGANVVSLDYTDTPDYEFRIGSPGQPFFLDSTVSMLVVGPPEAGLRALTVTGNGVQTAVSVDGAGGSVLSASTTSAGAAASVDNFGTGGAAAFKNASATDRAVTIENTNVGGGLQVTVPSGPALAVSGGTSVFAGPVTLGDVVGNTVTVKGTTTFNESASLATGKVLTGEDFDTIDADGVVRPGEVRFYSDATPSTTTGVMQFAGRWVSIGLSGAARKLSVPFESWVAGPVATVNAIDDTGAEVTLTLIAGDTLIVEMTMDSRNTSAANNVNIQLEANAVVIGGTAPHRPVVADVYFTIRRVVVFTAPADNVYTFKARHGASADTTRSTNIHILARHAL